MCCRALDHRPEIRWHSAPTCKHLIRIESSQATDLAVEFLSQHRNDMPPILPAYRQHDKVDYQESRFYANCTHLFSSVEDKLDVILVSPSSQGTGKPLPAQAQAEEHG